MESLILRYSGLREVTINLEYRGSVGKIAISLPSWVRDADFGSKAPSFIRV
jgi:hypothetical protein